MPNKLKSHFLCLIYFTSILLLAACSKKADNDAEIREMIVGTWKGKTRNFTFGGEIHIMEFTSNGRYREIGYYGSKNSWNSADTAGIGSLNPEILMTFQDSVYYEINQDRIIFNIKNLKPD